jgi:hypothetical protein
MRQRIIAALLVLALAAGIPACVQRPVSDVEALVNLISPEKSGWAVAGEVKGLKGWLQLNVVHSGPGPDFDKKRLDRSFTQSVRAADADWRTALSAALSVMDAGERKQALDFFRSADGRRMLAEQRRHAQAINDWIDEGEERAAPAIVRTEAEKRFAESDAGKAMAAAMEAAEASAQRFPRVTERAAAAYCAGDACAGGEKEMFRRMYASAHMTSARGEHAMWGQTAGDIFHGEKEAALARAACEGKGDLVKRLVSQGANPNEIGEEGYMKNGSSARISPVLWAMDCGSVDGVEALLEAGADPNLAGGSGSSPVLFAAKDEEPEMLRAMLAHGGDPNAHSERESALTVAWRLQAGLRWVEKLPEERVRANWEALLAAGADVNFDVGPDPAITGVHLGISTGAVAEEAALFDDWPIVLELLNRGYSHDLNKIARLVEQADVNPLQERQAAKLEVIRILRSRGLQMPAGTMGRDIEPKIGWIDYRKLNGELAKAGIGRAILVSESNPTPQVKKPPFNGEYFQLWYLADVNAFVEASDTLKGFREVAPAGISTRWGLTEAQLAAVREAPGSWRSVYAH